ncbi:MAG: putative Ig domain-containing protein, partial [Chlorobiales bacterium]|nr:putative Ig domain-containing protein [Chlorobiales bacterium]
YLNDGSGGFPATGTIFTAVDRSKAIVAGDVDGDGAMDLVTATDDNNRLYLVDGTAGVTNRDQLFATARSTDVGNGQALRFALTDNRVTEERNYQIWVSDNGGTSWLAVQPGVSIDPGTGNDLRWRADFNTNRDWATQPEISVLQIQFNTPGPSITGESQSTDEDALFSLDITADAGSSNDIFFIQEEDPVLPTWLSLVTDYMGTWTITGTPTNDDVGVNTFDLEVVDAAGAMATATFNITVDNTDDDPVLDTPIPDQNATDDTAFNLDVSGNFSDPDVGDTLTFSASGLPASGNLTISTAGVISGTPDNSDVGVHNVTVTADDGVGGSTPAQESFSLTVQNVNSDPFVD